MTRISLFFLLFCATLMLKAQIETVTLFPDGAPGVKTHQVVEHNVGRKDGLQRIKGITKPEMYVFLPQGADGETPAVVICPGGGYSIVSIESEGYNIARWFQERGVAAFVLKYRLPIDEVFERKEEVALQDVQQSFNYIKTHAKRLNVDESKVGVMGFSAGGHLAACASVLYKTPLINASVEGLRPAFSILIYPVITFQDEYTHKGSRNNLIGKECNAEMKDYYSCEKQVDKNTPMTFLLHSKDDKAVPCQNSILYKEALDSHGVKSRLVILETGGHGFGFRPNAVTNVWTESLDTWLQEVGLVQ